MRVVIQRVSHAEVEIDGKTFSSIGHGLMVLAGVSEEDNTEDIEWLAAKIVNLRIFPDEAGVMNKSLLDIEGEIMVVSQFTLMARTRKGHRPSYIDAARPEISVPVYEAFVKEISKYITSGVKTGVFGADMNISMCNLGPTTICIDTKRRE